MFCPFVRPSICQSPTRQAQASQRLALAYQRLAQASLKLAQASSRLPLGLLQAGSGLLEDGQTYGWDVQIPPIFYRTSSPLVASGVAALLS